VLTEHPGFRDRDPGRNGIGLGRSSRPPVGEGESLFTAFFPDPTGRWPIRCVRPADQEIVSSSAAWVSSAAAIEDGIGGWVRGPQLYICSPPRRSPRLCRPDELVLDDVAIIAMLWHPGRAVPACRVAGCFARPTLRRFHRRLCIRAAESRDSAFRIPLGMAAVWRCAARSED